MKTQQKPAEETQLIGLFMRWLCSQSPWKSPDSQWPMPSMHVFQDDDIYTSWKTYIYKLNEELISGSNTNMAPFLIVCSLGNPGPQHARSRHNMGHIVNDKLREYLDYGPWTKVGKIRQASIASGLFPMLLYRSESYMNDSGVALSKNWSILRRQQVDNGYDPVLVVLHDELSLAVGKTQLRAKNASPRGHNGLKSVRNEVGPIYYSIAIGIGKPADQSQVPNYVLSRLSEQEMDIVSDKVVVDVCEKLESLINE